MTKPVGGWKQWIAYIVAGGVVLFVLLAIVVLSLRGKRKNARGKRTSALAGQTLQSPELAAQLQGSTEVGNLAGGTVASIESLAPGHKLDGPLLRAKALQLASEDPATAAIIIRKWLNAGVNTQTAAR
jgi:flagellar biosynthesis/type III secretory pathway M-ring protein FliF/YscJ